MAAGIDHTYDGDFLLRRRRRGRVRLRRRRASRTSTSPAGRTRPRSTGTSARSAVRSSFDQVLDSATDARPSHRRLPARHRRRRHTDLAVLAAGENVAPARARRLRVSSGPTRTGASTAAPTGRPRSARPGRARRRCRRWRSATTSNRCRRQRRQRTVRRQPSCSGPDRTAMAGTPDRRQSCRPAAARCRCCSATGTDRAGVTCGSATTASTTSPARSSCGGWLPDEAPTRVHRGRRLGDRSRSGAWGSPARTSRATACPRST